LKFLKVIVIFYIVLCGTLYFFQEKLIFFPQKLDKNYKFTFDNTFEEWNIKSTDGKLINGLLFKAKNSKGVIFYLHGNGSDLSSWGKIASIYTDLNYDIFIMDYRSYGKSEGEISNEKQLFLDNQMAYNEIKKLYNEDKIIIIGYSIGTGLASQLASTNNPKLLILQAPYYNLSEMMANKYPLIPTFLLKYKFATNEYLKNCKIPVIIFHGNKDKLIEHTFSLKLQKEFKQEDRLIILDGQGHNAITYNPTYQSELKKILHI